MTNNRVLRVFLILAIGVALGFLDYKTPVDFDEVETLELTKQALIDHTVKNGGLPPTLEPISNEIGAPELVEYQRLSENEFSIAIKDRNYYLDQNGTYHSPNGVVRAKLSLWRKSGIRFQFLYLFLIGAVGIGLIQKSQRYKARATARRA